MTAGEMRRMVDGELAGFPRGPRGSAQNLFRTAYNMCRLNSLGRKPEMACSPMAAYQRALEAVRGTHPDFVPVRRLQARGPDPGR